MVRGEQLLHGATWTTVRRKPSWMYRCDRVCEVACDGDGLVQVERAAVMKRGVERLPRDEVHDEPRRCVGSQIRRIARIKHARHLHSGIMEQGEVGHLVQHA